MQFNQLKYSTVLDWKKLKPVQGFVAMGNFDGVHLAHKKLLSLKEKNRISVLTFTPHPAIAMNRIDKDFLITTDYEKELFLKKLGIDNIVFLKFTEELSRMSALEFSKRVLKEKLSPEGVIVGYDHHFGKNREGTPEFLKENSESLGMEIIIKSEVRVNGESVSSTIIRELLREGKMKAVNKLLGHPYIVSGKVVEGGGLGRNLGYPTANIKPHSDYKLLPPNGVYSAVSGIDNKEYPTMLYIGKSPTYGENDTKIELHLLGFEGNLYSRVITANIYSYIREDKKFESQEELIQEINNDKKIIIDDLKEVTK